MLIHQVVSGTLSLKGYAWPPGVGAVFMHEANITSLAHCPPDLKCLDLGVDQDVTESLFPDRYRQDLDRSQLTSLEGIPPGVHSLHIRGHKIDSLEGLPPGLICLYMRNDMAPHLGSPWLFTAAYCDILQHVDVREYHHEEIDHELYRALRVPLNERPARVVLVVLSSSSVSRVGLKAAVRRLNRADLVREMAGMLG